jgi:hypothetical protein
MRITFRQSGGFAGLIRGCTLDTNQLSPGEGSKLRSLVEQSGILRTQTAHSTKGRDMFCYEITVEDDDQTHSLEFDDLTLSKEARRLIDYMQSKSNPER